jgi:hypothetical protein
MHETWSNKSLFQVFYILGLGIPIIFVVCFHLQAIYDKVRFRITST